MKCINPLSARYPLHGYIDYYTGDIKHNLQFRPILNAYYEQSFINGSLYYMTKYSYDTDYPDYVDIKVPCGKCVGCHANKCRDYTTRSIHEFYSDLDKNHNNSMFITLTFNNDMLEKRELNENQSNYSVSRNEIVKFNKRLRYRIKKDFGKEIVIYGSGEYGSKKGRPHYHLLIYGFKFPDLYTFDTKVINGQVVKYQRSTYLEDFWKPAYSDDSYGFSLIGDVNQSTCQYVSSYMSDKLDEYSKKDYENEGKEKPFLITPHSSGLGKSYFLKNYKEIVNVGYCHWHNKIKAPIPDYYINLLKDVDYDLYCKVKLDRIKNMVHNLYDLDKYSTRGDLLNYEEALKLKYSKKVRSYEKNCFSHNI